MMRQITKIRSIIYYWIFIQAGMLFSANPGDIVITEFFFQSEEDYFYEYVEFFNTTNATIDLEGWKIEINEIEDNYQDITILYPFNIAPHTYIAVLSKNGKFKSFDLINYCSQNFIDSYQIGCNEGVDELYWHFLTFTDLSNSSGKIKISDSSSNPIDSVLYDSITFPVGDGIIGKAAEFILDPTSDAHIKNDDGSNWRSSQYESEWLWNPTTVEAGSGSPLIPNFITPSISIEAIETQVTKNTICTFVSDSTICQPGSDGHPGGNVAIQLTGSAVNASGVDVTLDSLFWEMYNYDDLDHDAVDDSSIVDSPIWYPIHIQKDTNTMLNKYNIPLVARDILSSNRFLGKTDTTIYIKQEINTPPKIQTINDQTSQAIINIFENSYDSLFAVVTDSLLCEASCTREDSNFYFPNAYFGVPNYSTFGSYDNYEKESPFLWSSPSDSVNLLSTKDSLITYFRAPIIDSLNNMSANNIRDTLLFKLQATDPFGAIDTSLITVIVHNKNQKPTISDTATSIQANLNSLNIIAGYVFQLAVTGNQIELHKFDASGEFTETTIIAEITDLDNDQTFTILPQGNDCEEGFEVNYCVTGNTIRTKLDNSYQSLIIPFSVDDGVFSPIDGFPSNSLSETSNLIIQISHITHSVSFAPIVPIIDDNYHLPEDSTDIEFSIAFKLDDNDYDFNTKNLDWFFHQSDWDETEQRVFAIIKTDISGIVSVVEFSIDSLYSDYNGQTGIKVGITDNDNDETALSDTIIIDIPIYIDQRNDAPKLLSKVIIEGIEYDPSNDTIHIAEDTTHVEFKLQVDDIDSDTILNNDILYYLSAIQWSYTSATFNESMIINVNDEYKELMENSFVFEIDSLLAHYNGLTHLNVAVTDDGNEQSQINIPIYIDQRNDTIRIESITFDSFIELDDDYFHLAEDTVNIGYTLQISDFDAIESLNHSPSNYNDLTWTFHKLFEWEDTLRVFSAENENNDGFIIHSLYPDYNGRTGLKVVATDNGNGDSSQAISYDFAIPIYIDQRNDALEKFSLFPSLGDYSIVPSSIDSVREELFFRLPQSQNVSEPTIKNLRFEWERNDILDVDIDTTLNGDSLLSIFYRLELVDSTAIIILADSIYHDNEIFAGGDRCWVDIDFHETKFPFYNESMGYPPQDSIEIDINGNINYKWRIVAKNYSIDELGGDPFQISSGWDSTDFKIDLIQPKVEDFNIMTNEMSPGFYHVLWESNGLLLTDSTTLSIYADENKIIPINSNPRRITDNLYNFTGIFEDITPSDLSSVVINFDLQIRDKAMNSGESKNKVSYYHVNPDSTSSFSSSSGITIVSIQPLGLDQPVDIFMTEVEYNEANQGLHDIYQLTESVHFFPKDISLNKPGLIHFDINDYLSSEVDKWQYVIMEMDDDEPKQLTTYISDGILSADINELSSFAVDVNPNIINPLPTTFKLKGNYPNPFNPTTVIPLEIPTESFVRVAIYNILGREVVVLLEDFQNPGYQYLQWDGNNQFGQRVSSGIYFVRVQYKDNIYIQKMMLLK